MNKSAKIIFLNGVGSVGKTSIAKALQTILTEPYLHVGIDAFMNMLPERYMGHEDGVFFKTLEVNGKPVVEVATGAVGKTLFKGMRHAMAALAEQGNNLIIDEVLIGDGMQEYVKLFSAYQVFYVGIFAPLDVIEERERLRGDRLIGLARWQYDIVHEGKSYDLEIDASQLSPLECAEMIRDALIANEV